MSWINIKLVTRKYLSFLFLAFLLFPISSLLGMMMVENYETLYIRQSLTHDPSDPRTFLQRYLINDTFWNNNNNNKNEDNSPHGPILFYTGNEGDIETFWKGNGFLRTLAPRLNALVIFGEARYYGQSTPPINSSSIPRYSYDDFSTTTTGSYYEFLSTELILADYASFLHQYADQGIPIITFGGSYGGTLSTFFRESYPEIVIGAIAASAPIGYYQYDRWDEYNVSDVKFANIISWSYDRYDGCLDSIESVSDAIRYSAVTNVEDLLETFNACSMETLIGITTGMESASESELVEQNKDAAALFQYALESLPQMDYPYTVDHLPSNPVNAVCAILKSAMLSDDNVDDGGGEGLSSKSKLRGNHQWQARKQNQQQQKRLVQAAAVVTHLILGPFSSTAINSSSSLSCTKALPMGGVGGIPGDGPGTTPWGYQSCKETLHPFSSSRSSNNLRNYTFDIDLMREECSNLYGIEPDLHLLSERYGRKNLYDLPRMLTNVFWSNGELDPWHGGGFLSTFYDDNYGDNSNNNNGNGFCLMPNGAHHFDLREPRFDDPEDVIECRKREEQAIRSWLEEFYTVAKKKKKKKKKEIKMMKKARGNIFQKEQPLGLEIVNMTMTMTMKGRITKSSL